MTFDEAICALYQTEHERFVAERKRLAAELRAAGDREGAARLAKLARPSISAWATNQLYWHARDAFDQLLATAARLREGDLAASAAHRDALAQLRRRAANILADGGHTASEAILRRVAANLSAIAAAGGFAPDAPGALAADRAAPGFEAAGAIAEHAPPAAERSEPQTLDDERRAAERLRRKAEHERVSAALRTARGDVQAEERRVEALEQQLRDARASIEERREIVADLERRLAALDEPGRE